MKYFSIRRVGRVALALLAIGSLCLSLAAIGWALGGNQVDLCKNGGWQTLHRSDGSPFPNQGACVSYAARGGTFVT
jgi:hypothetical protein